MVALARAQYELGRRDHARATLESMALNQSLNPDGVIACATVAANAKDFETAERLLQSIRSNYPEPAALSYRVALMQFRANRINDSQKTLLASIENGQHSSQIYDLLGHCYASQNKLQSAIASFEKAIDQEPSEESHYLDALQLLAENQLWRVLIRIAERGVATATHRKTNFRALLLLSRRQSIKNRQRSPITWMPFSSWPRINYGES